MSENTKEIISQIITKMSGGYTESSEYDKLDVLLRSELVIHGILIVLGKLDVNDEVTGKDNLKMLESYVEEQLKIMGIE